MLTISTPRSTLHDRAHSFRLYLHPTGYAMRLPLATFIVSFLALSGAVAQEWRPQLVARDESDDRKIPNFRFDSRHTSGGPFQISDTNWRAEAPVLGIDLNVYPNALSAPEQLQGQVAGRMWAKYRYMPWVCCNARLRQH